MGMKHELSPVVLNPSNCLSRILACDLPVVYVSLHMCRFVIASDLVWLPFVSFLLFSGVQASLYTVCMRLFILIKTEGEKQQQKTTKQTHHLKC